MKVSVGDEWAVEKYEKDIIHCPLDVREIHELVETGLQQ